MKKFILLFICGLIVHGSVNAMGNDIFQAAHDGDAELVSNLLLSGADPNLQDRYGDTPLHSAAINNHPEVVRVLIDSGLTDVNKQDRLGYTPLHFVCQIQLPDPSQLPQVIQEAMMNAVLYNQPIDTRDPIMAPLVSALRNCPDIESPGEAERQSIVQMLIAAGAMINQKATDGNTPLHHAMKSLPLEIIQTLIAAGADITITNHKGQTPLDCLLRMSIFVLEQPRPDLVNLLNRVKNYPRVAKDQLLALLGAGHSRLGAGSPAQLAFHQHSEVARLIAPFISKGAFEDALYGHNQ